MNNSFIKDYVEIPSFSQRDLFIIIVVGIVSASLGLLLAVPSNHIFDLTPLLNAVNIVGMTFATGLFSFLTAGLLFSSQASRSYLLRRINEVGAKRAYLIRTLHTFLVTSLFTIIITIIAFLQPLILGTFIYYPAGIDYFAFLPLVLGASLVVSICLTSIASSLAVITDDWRLCTVLGSVSTIVIAFIAGWNISPSAFNYSLTRNLTLLSPHNIVRALTIQLSGYQFESANDMVDYVGFVVSIEGIVGALLILGAISIVLLFIGQKVLSKTSTRWTVLEGMIPDHKIWASSHSAEKLQEITRIRRGLKLQRGLTITIVCVLIVSMLGGVSVYTTQIQSSTTIIHYVSPVDGERVPVGSWIIFDVDVRPPYPDLFNLLRFFCGIENWGNASDTLSFYYGILNMSSTDFDLLEESSRLDLLFSRENRTDTGGSGFGVGKNLEESYGPYVCVLKIVSVADPTENSYIEAELLIIQAAH